MPTTRASGIWWGTIREDLPVGAKGSTAFGSSSADAALRLSRGFETSERFWLDLQVRYDPEVERDRLGRRLKREVAALQKPRLMVEAWDLTASSGRWPAVSRQPQAMDGVMSPLRRTLPPRGSSCSRGGDVDPKARGCRAFRPGPSVGGSSSSHCHGTPHLHHRP